MTNSIEFTDDKGVAWHKYACRYTDQDGKPFVFDLWATSDVDAELRAVAVRASFQIDGRIAAVIDGVSGAVLADSSVPVNESGVTH